MKKRLSLFSLALAMLAVVSTAEAQIGQNFTDFGGVAGPSVYEQRGFQPTGGGDLQLGMPGRVWVRGNAADQGLGFNGGSYATLGMKRRLFEDFLDGRWLGEARLHHSIDGGFFANLGIERVFSIDAAGADVSLGAWYDYDDDQQGEFAHTMNVVGISGKIKTRKWDLLANGYFPVGTSDYTEGDITGVNCFLNHSIVLTPGIDSALRGFDVAVRMRPKALAMYNGTFDIGGYGYGSDIVEYFGGGRARVGFQAPRGFIVNAEVNYDDRFDVTGVLSVGWIFGVNVRGHEYAGLGRDLEETVRNDHVLRVQQDLVLAIDPDTGRPYNVWHVDNTADAGFATGEAETPFTRLAQAEAASGPEDIIFVREGDGTARNMRDGIVLQDGQLLLGDGVQHIIPIQNGLNFILCNDIDGNRPTISSRNNLNGVTLANNNTVRGFIIDGNESVGGMANGIYGNGSNNGIIEDNVISNAILNGVLLENITGDWNFARNTITSNGFDGIQILNACDPLSTFNFEDNIVSSNGRDGIHMLNYDAESVTFLRNVTNDNGRHGVNLDNFKNTSGNGLDLDFVGHEATGNAGLGIRINGGDGDLSLVNTNASNNRGGGLQIVDWTNTDPSTRTFIGTTPGGISNFSNNTPGTGIDVLLRGGDQRLFITGTQADGNGVGIQLRTEGVGTTLTSEIVNNLSFNNNTIDGIRSVVLGGSTQSLLVEQNNGIRLPIQNSGGNGISLLVGDNLGVVSTLNASIGDVSIAGNRSGIFANVFDQGNINLMVEDSNIDNNGGGLSLDFATDGTALVNSVFVNRVTMLDNGGSAIGLTTTGETLTDLFIVDSTLTNTVAFAPDPFVPGAFTNGVRGGGFLSGVVINATGDAGSAAIENRTRLFMSNNTVENFLADGVAVVANGDASVWTRFDSNLIQRNGFGFGTSGVGTGTIQNNPIPNFFFTGIRLTTTGADATINASVFGNRIIENFGSAIALQNSGQMNVVMDSNDLWSDYGDDPQTIPSEASNFNLEMTNVAGGDLCVAMSSNFVPDSVLAANGGAPVNFTVELDGITNGLTAADFGANFLFQNFGTSCQDNIDAEETAFLAEGFPPLTPR